MISFPLKKSVLSCIFLCSPGMMSLPMKMRDVMLASCCIFLCSPGMMGLPMKIEDVCCDVG